jgi:hypothetical protein
MSALSGLSGAFCGLWRVVEASFLRNIGLRSIQDDSQVPEIQGSAHWIAWAKALRKEFVQLSGTLARFGLELLLQVRPAVLHWWELLPGVQPLHELPVGARQHFLALAPDEAFPLQPVE